MLNKKSRQSSKKAQEKYLKKLESDRVISELQKVAVDNKILCQLTSSKKFDLNPKIAKLKEKNPNSTVISQQESLLVQREAPKVNIFEMQSYENPDFQSESKPKKICTEKNMKSSSVFHAFNPNNPFKKSLTEKFLIESKVIPDQIEKLKVMKIEDLYENDSEIYDAIIEELRNYDELQKKMIATQELNRSNQIEETRKLLPILAKESEILESVNRNLVTLVCGETGSGKSTQVPQILYEYGYSNKNGANPGMIGITQPRRLAAISLAKRVSDEMNLKLGEEISYQVRFENGGISDKLQVKFMTDGILLNEMLSDFLLMNYSLIILDEVHERKVNTDILIGLLSRIIGIRAKLTLQERKKHNGKKIEKYKFYPLRIVLMSATLRAEDFQDNKILFPKQIPMIHIEARQHPVQIFFSVITKEDYIREAIKKCAKIHTKLPPGAVLIFLTGEQEIHDFCKLLSAQLHEICCRKKINEDDINEDLGEKIIDDFIVLPLFSKLPLKEQELIFKNQKNKRLFIASTNIAETSLTIPDVKYVVDCGKEKVKKYNEKLSIIRYEIEWISQSSADQRSGRAGRTAPGICYRLYSPAVFSNMFSKHSIPEILKCPLDSVILQLKAIGIKDALNFPFISSPNVEDIKKSILKLIKLEALRDALPESLSDSSEITTLGRLLAYIPLHPIFAKFLLHGRMENVFGYCIILGSCFGTQEILKKPNFYEVEMMQPQCTEENLTLSEKLAFEKEFYQQKKSKKNQICEEYRTKYKEFYAGDSELFMLLNIIGEFFNFVNLPENMKNDLDSKLFMYCKKFNLIFKSLKECFRTILQIVQILNDLLQNQQENRLIQIFFTKYIPPSNDQMKSLLNLLIKNFPHQIARKINYFDQKNRKCFAYETMEMTDHVHIPIQSFLYSKKPAYLWYTSIFKSDSKNYLDILTFLPNATVIYENYPDEKKLLPSAANDEDAHYSKNEEKLYMVMKAVISKRKWEIAPILIEILEKNQDYYFFMVKEFLSGRMLKKMINIRSDLCIDPNQIQKDKLNPQIKKLIEIFQDNNITSHKTLISLWKQPKNKKFLLDEIINILKINSQQKWINAWPPIEN